ncbi:MAG: hypothetical protein ACXQS8_06655 [Candidatus Helarchaeales archaeon]
MSDESVKLFPLEMIKELLLTMYYDRIGNCSLYGNRQVVVEFSSWNVEMIEDVIYILDKLSIKHGKLEKRKKGKRYRVRISRLEDVFTLLSILCAVEELSETKLEKARAALALVKFLWLQRKSK